MAILHARNSISTSGDCDRTAIVGQPEYNQGEFHWHGEHKLRPITVPHRGAGVITCRLGLGEAKPFAVYDRSENRGGSASDRRSLTCAGRQMVHTCEERTLCPSSCPSSISRPSEPEQSRQHCPCPANAGLGFWGLLQGGRCSSSPPASGLHPEQETTQKATSDSYSRSESCQLY